MFTAFCLILLNLHSFLNQQKMSLTSADTIVDIKSFGLLTSINEVLCYTLKNKNGMELSVINYGATITSLKVPLNDAEKIDVVLGFENLDDYIHSYSLPSAPYFGAVVGRYAGRINKGQFPLNGKEIILTKNHGNHHLHGGVSGFSQQFWKVKKINGGDYPSIKLEYVSHNEEEGFPGMLVAEVTYMLTESNQVIVDFHAYSTEDTVINLTQHTYFNLEGQHTSIKNQEVTIYANAFLDTTAENIPTGEIKRVDQTEFDFTNAKKVPSEIDHTFVLEKNQKVAAVLESQKNKLKMTVLTDQPAVHVYVGGDCFGELPGKNNAAYHSQSGICFETQNYPDAPNHENFPNSFLKKGNRYHHQTIFAFEKI